MELRDGYKQTDAGLIPVEWDYASVGELLKFKNGLNKGKEFFGYGVPIINYNDVYLKPEIKAKDILGRVSLSAKEIKLFEVKKGDVFFTRTSETPEEVGISSVLTEDVDNTVFSGFILRARSNDNRLYLSYKKYCFSTKTVRKEIVSSSTYTTRALTNGKVLSKIIIPIPPLPEQKAIATALSDIDGLIDSLTKLIKKKKKIKQGAMQELLTGKKRLEGFSGEWTKTNLCKICNITKGQQLNKSLLKKSGRYSALNGGILPSGYTDSWNREANTISISEGGESCGYVSFNSSRFWCGGHCYTLENVSTIMNNIFLYHKLKLLEKEIMALRVGSGLPNIQQKSLNEFSIYMPQETNEQTAIANILSDMDTEIESLQNKLNKYKAIKLGMMQELLTGKTRLLEGA